MHILDLLLNGKVSAHFLMLAVTGLPDSGESDLYTSLLGKDVIEESHSTLTNSRYAEAVCVKQPFEPSKWFSLREYDSCITAVTMALCNASQRLQVDKLESDFSSPLLKSTISSLSEELFKIDVPDNMKVGIGTTVTFLNVVDFGVNRAVYEIVPLIARGCSRAIILNLLDFARDAEKMKEHPDLSRYTKDGDNDHLMQLRSRLHYFLYIAGILLPPATRPGSKPRAAAKAPRVLLVGTHKEICSKEIKSEARMFRNAIDTRAAEAGVDGVIQPGMPIVNPTSAEDIAELKSVIESMIEAQNFKVDMPLKWLLLRSVLHHYSKEENTFYIPRPKLVDYAQQCNITEEAGLQEFLATFRDGGSIITCPRIRTLVRNIITDPIRFVQELEKLYYPKFVGLESSRETAHFNTCFSQGIICDKLAESMWGQHAQFLLGFLQDVHLATVLDKSYKFSCPDCASPKCYFMPSLREKPYKREPSTDTNSLFVVFESDYVPAHIQTHFVSALGEKFGERIELKATEHYNTTVFIYTHSSETQFTITVIFHADCVEIQLNHSTRAREVLASVYSALKTITVEIFSTQHPVLQSQLAVLCPSSHFVAFHACPSASDSVFCETCNHSVELSEATKLWISATYQVCVLLSACNAYSLINVYLSLSFCSLQGPNTTSFTQYGEFHCHGNCNIWYIKQDCTIQSMLQLKPQCA